TAAASQIQSAGGISFVGGQVQAGARLRRQSGPKLPALPSTARRRKKALPRRTEADAGRSALSLPDARHARSLTRPEREGPGQKRRPRLGWAKGRNQSRRRAAYAAGPADYFHRGRSMGAAQRRRTSDAPRPGASRSEANQPHARTGQRLAQAQ